jgi:hypothetical protein
VCHQLDGYEKDLITGLNRLCSPQTGLTFAAKIYLNSQCEGNTTIYEADKYPFNCIGPVRFFWHPKNQNENRSIWIWSHPAIYKQVEDQLTFIFKLTKTTEQDSPQIKKRKISQNIEENHENYFTSINNSNIKLKSLKDKLNRFKLLGPMSTTILANLLQTTDSDNEM